MKTDAIFYKLFQIDPNSLFKLVGINLEGRYNFKSIELKDTQRRLDGLFIRTDGDGPTIFLEIQGYKDPKIYWRLFQEVTTYYMQSETFEPFISIVLFIDEKHDPGNLPFSCHHPHRLICAVLQECMNHLGGDLGLLSVIEPLILSDAEKLYEYVPKWKQDILALEQFTQGEREGILELLEYVILQRFPNLSYKEIQQMVQLTPLEETKAVRELIDMGIERGIEQGIERGELIGNIQMAQRILKRYVIPKEVLKTKTIDELKTILHSLEADIG